MSEQKVKSINQAQYKAEYIPENSANLNTITFVSSIPKNSSNRQLRRKKRYHCVKKGSPRVSSGHEEKEEIARHVRHGKMPAANNLNQPVRFTFHP
jgi:hypothetical protein